MTLDEVVIDFDSGIVAELVADAVEAHNPHSPVQHVFDGDAMVECSRTEAQEMMAALSDYSVNPMWPTRATQKRRAMRSIASALEAS